MLKGYSREIFLVSSGSALAYGILRDDDLDAVPSHEKIKFTELGERCSFTKRHIDILESGKPIVFDNVLTKEELSMARQAAMEKSKCMVDSQQDDNVRTDMVTWVGLNNAESDHRLHLPIKLLRGVAVEIEKCTPKMTGTPNTPHCHLKYRKCVCYHIMKIRSFTRNIATMYINHYYVFEKNQNDSIWESFSPRHLKLANKIHLGWIRLIAPSTNLWWRREFTAILYLNASSFNHGGELRCYYGEGETRNPRISNQLVEDWLFLIADYYPMRYCQRHLQGLPFPCGFVNDDLLCNTFRSWFIFLSIKEYNRRRPQLNKK